MVGDMVKVGDIVFVGVIVGVGCISCTTNQFISAVYPAVVPRVKFRFVAVVRSSIADPLPGPGAFVPWLLLVNPPL
jgi:hypothetical protein